MRSIGRRGTRGKKHASVACMNDAPLTGMELAEYFASLPIERLQSCWVGCVLSIVLTPGFRPIELARPLMVVAVRLHRAAPDLADCPLDLWTDAAAVIEAMERRAVNGGGGE